LQIICDDRWSYIRSDVDHLNEYRRITEVIVCDPCSFDESACAGSHTPCLHIGYGKWWIFAGAIVSGFYIRWWRKITGAVNGDILWQRKRIEDWWDDIDKYDGETEKGGISEIINCLVEYGYRIATMDGIIDMISSADGKDAKGDDHSSGDVAGDSGRRG